MFSLLAVASLLLTAPASSVTGCARNPIDSLRVPILVYHGIAAPQPRQSAYTRQFEVSPPVFEAQMQYLKDHGISVISLASLVDALEERCAVPDRAVVITFDDGHENQFVSAFPVLKRFGYTATFFPFTHAMDRNPHYMTWAQLKEMQSAGMTIGSHTSLHPRIDKLHDPERLREEIAGSRELLQKKLGSSVEFFAFPFGALSAEGEDVVRAAGYSAARAFTGGPWNASRDMFHLRAVPVTENMARFEHYLNPGTAAATHPKGTTARHASATTVTSRHRASSKAGGND